MISGGRAGGTAAQEHGVQGRGGAFVTQFIIGEDPNGIINNLELPNYRLPGLKNVAQLLWEKARDFLQKAFTVIFAATIVIWFLQNFDLQLRLTADPQASILARIAGDIAPLFGPLGFADWRISTALITGFMAKESVVSSLLILFGSEAALSAALTPAQAAPLLVFCLLYTPCIAAVASVKRELGTIYQPLPFPTGGAISWWAVIYSMSPISESTVFIQAKSPPASSTSGCSWW